ncbi:hypothetical protein Prudu_006097 [Prunus dulcis]|uniref:Uncharacterized protein n=1 Tax=Prunus dulcis TaxID=3755 RepID=A0A4Y1QZ03_PRUDU|nr:hypothetical protein Prudu_006097 [Prunus dulcis]
MDLQVLNHEGSFLLGDQELDLWHRAEMPLKLIRNCIALEETKTEMHNSLFRDSYTLSRGSPSSPLDQVPERGFLEKLLLPFIELVLYVSNDAVESIGIAPKLDIVRFVVKICNKQPETAAQNLM